MFIYVAFHQAASSKLSGTQDYFFLQNVTNSIQHVKEQCTQRGFFCFHLVWFWVWFGVKILLFDLRAFSTQFASNFEKIKKKGEKKDWKKMNDSPFGE